VSGLRGVDELVVRETAAEAAGTVAERLVEVARAGGEIALSGGSAPRPAYEAAAELLPDWSGAGIWWGDERCVPSDDEQSNFRLARESLLDRLEGAPRAVHRIRGEVDAQAAADAYDEETRDLVLDLAHMGIGPDGHTASLFPHAPSLHEQSRRALGVPRPDGMQGVTLTLPMLSAARVVLFHAVGEQKAEAVRKAFAEEPDPATPASLLRSRNGATVVILDREAASQLVL
jgi:6-phosphogluconolactonase